MLAGLLPDVAYGSWRSKLVSTEMYAPGAQELVEEGAVVVVVAFVLWWGVADAN
jgi:hypothetical protein